MMGPSMIAALLVTSIGSPLQTENYFPKIFNYLIGFAGVGASHGCGKIRDMRASGVYVFLYRSCFSLEHQPACFWNN
ncbi:MAG: hypothetical protein Ct9H300mP28_12490 [Pseudomonadota bacterium]|nr:MAG: hypothetical protein Ct9H300mP28_12490 [Pseudomonadota bacterium]